MNRLQLTLALVPVLAFAAACGDDPEPGPAKTAPRITSAAVTAATEGQLYSYTVVVTGNPIATLTATKKPAWLTLEGRVLSGTPAAADVGMHEVTLTASNEVMPSAVQTFTITVSPAGGQTAPAITSTPVTSGAVGVAYTYTVTATGEPSPTFSASGAGGSALPGWLTFDAGGARLTGTPAAADVGDHDVVITATNGVSPDAVQSFTITVAATGVAPSFTSTPVTAATEGVAYSYTVTAGGTPAPSITATTIPAWLSFDGTTLSGTPGAADVGDHAITLTAANGVSPDALQMFTITVAAAVTMAPTFTSTPITDATEGVAYSYTATADGTPAPVLAATTIPAWLTFDPNTGVLSGTPGTADVGAHNVELTADNGVAPAATQTFTIDVVAAGVAPTFTSTPITDATEGVAYSYTATADGTPAPALAATTLPAWLVFDAASGLLSGTPGAGDLGPNLVELTAMNGVSPAATQTFTIDVTAAPVAPAFTSTPVTGATEGQAYSYTVTVTGSPAPTVTAAAAGGGALPAWLGFDGSTGVLSGTPGATDVGDVQVELTATNGVLPDATQAFTITVAAFTEAPAITSSAPATGQEGIFYSYTITVTGTPAPVITVGGLPAWLSFDGTTISGTPGLGDAGVTGDITVTADNGVPPAATQTFTINVAAFGVIALAGSPYVQDFEGGALPIGWAATGQWAVGAPTTGAASVGPPSLFDGDVAATNLTGNYANSANWTMTTPVFDFTGVTNPTLRFAHWHNFEKSTVGPAFTNYDGGNIKISTDNGASFVQLDPASVTPAYTGALASGNTMSGQQAWSGILADWQLVTIDLTANLAGMPLNQVVLRFDFGSDTTVARPGWYVDAVRIGSGTELRQPPMITSAPAETTIIAGTPFSYTVVATGSAPLTLTATGAAGSPFPAWLSFDAGTGVLSGTPQNSDGGDYTIVITAANGEPRDAVQTFTLTVVPIVDFAMYTFEGDVRTPAAFDPNVTASDIDNRNSNTTFVTGNPGRAMNSNGFTDAADPNYYQFTLTPVVGRQIIFTGFSFDHYRSATGPTDFQVSIVYGGVTTPLAGGAGTMPAATTWTPAAISFTDAEDGPYSGPVTIRIAAWGASSAAGTFRVDNVTATGMTTVRDDQAPVILTTAPATAQAGVAYSYTVGVDGWPAPTVTVTGLPAWLTYTSATRTIAGTPTGLNVGTSPSITITASNGILPNATEVFTIAVAAAPAVVVNNGTPVMQNFGAVIPVGWAANGGWEFGLPTTGAASVGPPSVLDGEVAATRLAANYATSVRWSMVTEVYDLTGVTAPVLQFHHWYNFERSTGGTNYDGANIKLSTDGGATFVELNPATVTPAYTGALSSGTTQMGGQQGWSGILADWQFVMIDLDVNLTGLPRNNVVIRFDMGSDSSTNRPGWYVDNVRVGALGDLSLVPSVAGDAPLSAREGVAYSYAPVVAGVPAPTVAATGAAGGPLPAWLTFNGTTLSGTPGAADVGVHNVEITATNVVGTDTQAFAIRVFGAAEPPTFSDGFEGGVGTWVIGFEAGTGSDWQIGTPTLVGPAACFAGTQCAGTILDGNYTIEDRLSYLQTPVINLTGIPDPAVRFRHYYRTESTYDGGNVKISTDGGATFTALAAGTVTPAYTGTLSTFYGNPLGGQLAWNGTGTTWTVVNVDLAANLAGLPVDQVVVRFEFGSDDDVAFPGWYIDDVSVGDLVTLP